MSMWKAVDSQLGQPTYLKVGQVSSVIVAAGGSGYNWVS